MGGRRAGQLNRLVGKGGTVTSAKRSLTRAIREEDPEAIARTSTLLAVAGDVGLQSIWSGLLLLPYLIEQAQELKRLSRRELDIRLHLIWAKVKLDKQLQTPSEVDKLAIESAKEALALDSP
jgi:hypothetical protein